MKHLDLSHPTPYGDRLNFYDVTAKLHEALEHAEWAQANHLYTMQNDVQHMAPGLLPPQGLDDSKTAMGRCETCTNNERLLEMVRQQLNTIKMNFMVEAIREEDRKHAK